MVRSFLASRSLPSTSKVWQAVVLLLLFGGPSPAAADHNQACHCRPRHCTAEYGQQLIDQGHYHQAVRVFTCLVEQNPTSLEGYRGRIEALLLLRRYSDALRDHAMITAFVLPVDPDGRQTLHDSYAARLAAAPQDIPALTGASFAQWVAFEYSDTLQLLKRLLKVKPHDRYGILFRGSARLLLGVATKHGVADLQSAIQLDPWNAQVRFVVADAYTYGHPDPDRAFYEASLALHWGLDTPRIHAILAVCYQAFGDDLASAAHLARHIELVTAEYVPTAPLAAGSTLALALVPGRTYEIPLTVTAGDTLTVSTCSVDFFDTVAVLLDPAQTPVLGSDDSDEFFAAFTYVAPQSGTYVLQVTSFESIDTGELVVTRD